MIDIYQADIVLTRTASDGRFVIFTSTDVQPGWPVPWWGAIADTAGDGFGLLVRLDEIAAPEERLVATASTAALAWDLGCDTSTASLIDG